MDIDLNEGEFPSFWVGIVPRGVICIGDTVASNQNWFDEVVGDVPFIPIKASAKLRVGSSSYAANIIALLFGETFDSLNFHTTSSDGV